jgi:outer membrane protein TolC
MSAVAIAAALVLAQPAPETLGYADALREAQAHNADLRAARARLDAARTIAWKAWASQLPQITAGASWTRNDVRVEVPASPPLLPEPLALQPLVVKAAQVQAALPVFAPQLWLEIGAADAARTQAERTVEAERREIVFGVARLYHGAVGSRYAVEITERQLAVAREHERDARVRHQAGTTPRLALLRAEIDRARAEQDLEAARAAYGSARAALATALDRQGSAFEVEMPAAEPSIPEELDLEASAVRERPEVLAAAAALTAAERARAAARAGYLPSVGAFAREQWSDPAGLSGERRSWAVGLALSWNVLDGTRREAQLREAGARVAEAEAGRRSAELRAREAVVRARLDLAAATANRRKAREQVELARESQRLAELSYRAGAATYIEVSDANNQLAAAELAALDEQVKSRLAALRLLEAAGRFEPL